MLGRRRQTERAACFHRSFVVPNGAVCTVYCERRLLALKAEALIKALSREHAQIEN